MTAPRYLNLRDGGNLPPDRPSVPSIFIAVAAALIFAWAVGGYVLSMTTEHIAEQIEMEGGL